ncbi:MAG: RNA 2',3'-cyclic phosphodiesterase [Veillonellaceae bacterium]|nr:RNA 2',3'-cyclic phosphodiesterase [Veillonellaceae bacterium]
MRLFIGIDFPPMVVDALYSLQNKIRSTVRGGRFPARDNLHLTLQFLGETPESRIGEIHQALSAVAFQHRPFQIAVGDRIGYFGPPNFVRVVWVGLTGELAALSVLQADVAQALREVGFPEENRPFMPHITLARDVTFLSQDTVRKDGRLDVPLTLFPPVTVRHFSLIVSEIVQGRRRYRSTGDFRLRGGAEA